MLNRKIVFLLLMLFAFCRQTAYSAIESENYLTVKPFFILPGETIKVMLEIENELDVYGYQTEIVLPEGITIPSTKIGSAVLYNKSILPVVDRMYGDTDNFNLTAQRRADGSVMLLAYSDYYIPFEGNCGAVAEITLVADKNLQPGVYSLKLRNSEVTVKLDGEEVGATKALTDIVAVCGTVSDDNGTVTLGGAFDEDALRVLNEKLATLDDVTAVDMNGVTLCEGKVVTVSPNALIYTKGAIGLTNETNVVSDGVCASLHIADGYQFVADGEFQVTEAFYERSLSAGKFGTVVLPFEPDAETKGAYNFYTFASKGSNYIVFSLVTEPEAGVPYIYENVSADPRNGFTASECTVSDVITEQETSGWTMKGTYSSVLITEPDVLEHTYYVSSNKIMCATKELRIKPFRAYMSGPAYTEAFGNGAQQAIAIHLDGTTSLDVLRDEAGKVSLIYDITGRQVSEGKSGIYVIDGKKYYKK